MSLTLDKARFEHYAFVWEPSFETRQSKKYPTEDHVAVEQSKTFDTSIPLTSRIVVERFLEYGCDRDRDIYLYRNRRIENFLKGLDLESLRRGSISDVNASVVLLDDRCDLGLSTATTVSESRPLGAPLTAHQFYLELSRSVCYVSSFLFQNFSFLITFFLSTLEAKYFVAVSIYKPCTNESIPTYHVRMVLQ
jgi:hypothetical protein